MRLSKQLVLVLSLILLTTLQVGLANASPSQIGQRCVTTNGDVLALETLYMQDDTYTAVGGNFTKVITKDNVSHSVRNLAVFSNKTCKLIYAGFANGYVRALGAKNSRLYVGGDFTNIDNKPYTSKIASLIVGTWKSDHFLPNVSGIIVRAVAYDSTRIYVATSSKVLAVNPSTGQTIWSKNVSGGSVRTLFSLNDRLYVGGLFDYYDSFKRHGLVLVNSSNGVLNKAFDANLRPNTHEGFHGGFNGQEALSIAASSTQTELAIGYGGALDNGAKIMNADSGKVRINIATAGDVQAIALLGSELFTGMHRNHSGPPKPYYAAFWNILNGLELPWNAHIEGARVNTNADQGNGGVQAVTYNRVSSRLYVGGAFSLPYVSLTYLQN